MIFWTVLAMVAVVGAIKIVNLREANLLADINIVKIRLAYYFSVALLCVGMAATLDSQIPLITG